MKKIIPLICIIILFPTWTYADGEADAIRLKDEALEILKANSNRQATPEQYAHCIYKLEQAQALLEKAGQDDTALAQEVSSSLFWARRFSNMQVISALERLRGGAVPPPPPPAKKKVEPPPKATQPDEPQMSPEAVAQAKAKDAFDVAEQFANSRSNDDYAIALRWFQMANEHPGTDYALKALELARAAQTRFSARTAPVVEELPNTPETDLLKEADALAARGKYEESFAIYQSSLKLKETLLGHRKLGHSYFSRGQQMKDELLPKLDTAWKRVLKEWDAAYEIRTLSRGGTYRRFNPKYPPLVEAQRQHGELIRKAYQACDYYDKAQSEFRAVLKLAPEQRDFDAAGHIGLCLGVRGDPNYRDRARREISKFLAEYSPANDLERSLYEFCKTDLARLKKG